MTSLPQGPNRLRLHNRVRVLEMLLERGRVSRAEIAEHTGISKVTTTLIVNELVEEGLLHEVSKTEGIVGRPAGLVELRPAIGNVVGFDVQPQALGLIQGNLRGEILKEETFVLEGSITKAILRQLETLDSLKQVVVAVPAPVGEDGLPQPPNSVPEFDAEKVLAWGRRRGVEVVLENDVKLGAVAEHRAGAASQNDNFALLAERASGIGLGLLLGGQLYRGERGFGGEIALVRWPQGRKLTPLEELPPPQRETALAQLVSGLAVALDLSLLVVHQDSAGALSLDLNAALQELVPPNVQVVKSKLGERAPVLGAFLEATRLAQAQLLHCVTVSAPLALPKGRSTR